MSETPPTETPAQQRDFSKPDTCVCEVARFDNDGHLANAEPAHAADANATAEAAVSPDVEETE